MISVYTVRTALRLFGSHSSLHCLRKIWLLFLFLSLLLLFLFLKLVLNIRQDRQRQHGFHSSYFHLSEEALIVLYH